MKYLFLVLFLASATVSNAQQLQTNWPEFDGFVKTIFEDSINNKVYVAGNFNNVYFHNPYGDLIDFNGVSSRKFAIPNEVVNAAIPDGHGGWYIGGAFTKVGDSVRNHIAQLDSTGQVTAKFSGMSLNDAVLSLALSGDTLYFGGYFTYIGSADSRDLTTFDATTGLPDLNYAHPDNVNNLYVDGIVYASIPDGSGGYYVGGSFTQINGQQRNNIARINANGTLNPWNPGAVGGVNTFCMAGNILYVGGTFPFIGGQQRNLIAAFDTLTGNVTSWNPILFGNSVNSIVVTGNQVYAGGDLSTISGRDATSLDATTGAVNNWYIYPDGPVNFLLLVGNTIYVAGNFTQFGGSERSKVASFNAHTRVLSNWNPNVIGGVVRCLASNGSRIYLGGSFYNVHNTIVSSLAIVDSTSGNVVSSDPKIGGEVYCINFLGTDAFISGTFSSVGGQTRLNLARISATSLVPTSWAPANIVSYGGIYTCWYNAGKVLAGGLFEFSQPNNRTYLASYNVKSNTLTSWAPALDNGVLVMKIKGKILYLGGAFTLINATTRNHLAALDMPTATLTSWNPNADKVVHDMSIINSATMFAGGEFTKVGGVTHQYISRIDLPTGAASLWAPASISGVVYAVATNGNSVYIGGAFTGVGSKARNYIAAIDTFSAVCTSWNPGTDDRVTTMKMVNGTLYIGGNFTHAGGQPRSYLAALDAGSGTTTSWNPSAGKNAVYGDEVSVVACDGSNFYAGGGFSYIGGVQRHYIACLDGTTGQPTSWNPGFNDQVSSIAMYAGNIYMAGYFDTTFNGQSHSFIVSFNASTGNVNSWDPAIKGDILSLKIYNGKMYVAGGFSGIGTTTRAGLAEIDIATAKATSWTPPTNSDIYDMAFYNNTMYVGGNFTYIGGSPRNRAASIDLSTGALGAWNPSITSTTSGNCWINSLTLQGNILYAGGSFTRVSGQPKYNLASFDLTSGSPTSYNPNSSGEVNCLTLHDSLMYTGGKFFYFGNTERKHIGVIKTSSGNFADWSPEAGISLNDVVNSICVGKNYTYLGGTFNEVTQEPRINFAVFTNYAPPSVAINQLGGKYYCTGSVISVPYSANGTFTNGNTFTVQLSDSTGSFSAPTNIGSLVSISNTGVITSTIPGGLPSGSNYRMRVVSSSPVTTSTDNGTGLVIKNNLTATISPTAVAICNGNTTSLQATGGNAILWSNGSTASTITVSPVATKDYQVTVSSGSGCSATATRQVVVNQLPDAKISTSSISVCKGNSATLTASGGSSYTWSGGLSSIAQVTFSPSSSKTYSVTVTDVNNCSNVASVDVTVNPVPVAGILPVDNTLCRGQSVTLTASGGGTYAWANGLGTNSQITVSPLISTGYTVTVTDGNNCTAKASNAVTVNIPPVAGIGGNSTLCKGASTILSASGGNLYKWSNGLGTDDAITVSPSSSIQYSVTVTDGNNCTDTASVYITVNPLPVATILPATVSFCKGQSATLTAAGGNGYKWNSGLGTDPEQTVSPISTTNYAVTVTDGNNCSASTTRTVTVLQPSAFTFNKSLCNGSSYQFKGQSLTTNGTYFDTLTNVAGCDSMIALTLTFHSFVTGAFDASICKGSSYFYNNQNLTTAGTYNDTLTAAGGCDSIVTLTLSVNLPPQPTITKKLDTLSTQVFASYQWLRNDSVINGATKQKYTLTKNGNYKVIVTDSKGCGDTSAALNVINTGIVTTALSGINIFPNPTDSKIIVVLPYTGSKALFTIEILNLLGEKVLPQFVSGNASEQIDLSQLSQGVYLIRITQGANVWLNKVGKVTQ